MKIFFTFLFLIYTLNSSAQFAIVSDKDSFVNIRAEGSKNSTIVDKLPNGYLIYCFQNDANWTNVDYQKKEKNLNGYIYKDRYKLVSDFPAFTIIKNSENSITLKKGNIEVAILQSKFDKRKHKFTYVKSYPTQIELIDNKQYWGRDGDMPTSQFEKVSIKTENKIITLPKSALEGLYEPSIHSAEVNYDKVNDVIYIQTMNSDGAGAYLVIWKIEKGLYKDRLIAYGF